MASSALAGRCSATRPLNATPPPEAYDTTTDFSTGNVALVGPIPGYATQSDYDAMDAQPNFYLGDAAGKSEKAYFLDASAGSLTSGGKQGLVAPLGTAINSR